MELWFHGRVVMRTTEGTDCMGKSDLLAHAAECERALQLVTEAEHRDVLQRLRSVWPSLAREQSLARDPEMQEDIAALQQLHAELAAAHPALA